MISEREQQKTTRPSDNYVAKAFVGLQPLSLHHTTENYVHNISIIFFGTDDFSLTTLKGLVDSGYYIAAVVTKPDSKSGRGQRVTAPAVKTYAIDHDIPVWQPTKISDANDDIKSLGGDITGVLAVFGKMIPASTLDLFNPGIINIHPSLLPLYRGSSPVESAIINGDNATGVTIMQIAEGMDSGPIYGQNTLALSGKETRPDLYKTLAESGTKLLLDLLPNIIDGSSLPIAQDESKAVYCDMLKKEEAWLDMANISAIQAERKIRAHLNFPKTKINLGEITIIITKAHVSNEHKTMLDIKCKDGKYLSIDELVAPSGKTMSAKDFINGYKLV